MKQAALPLLVIAVGIAWLLSAIGFLPAIDWFYTVGLAILGILSFVVLGFNKFTFVIGTFFIVASVFAVLRQTGVISFNLSAPLLVIVFGVLLLIAQTSAIPLPDWIKEDASRDPAP